MATVAQIKSWLGAYNRNFDQLCQALMWQVTNKFGTAPMAYSSANTARAASTIVSTNAAAAPAGAFHYWKIGTYGHVALSLGNGYCLMGSKHVTDRWGINAGVTTVAGYTATTGAQYVGWSNTNGRNDLTVSDTYGGGASGGAVDYAFGLTKPAQLALQQATNKLGLYTGLQDGVFGVLSVKAVQQALKSLGYLSASYTVDGVPGPVYGKALQTLAAKHGYTGPIDGAPGAATSAALVAWAATVVAPPVVTPPPPTKTGSFGIDVATPQKSIDFVKAKAEGVEFVIVKMGGLNVTPQYVAPNYAAQVTAAKAAGLKVGHYYLIGKGQSPAAQAEYFVKNLHGFDVNTDVLALDNERLDANADHWTDAQVADFFIRVQELTGIPATRLWHYQSAADYRNSKPWTETEALGVKVWWAAYGNSPTGHTPDHTPDLQGSVKDWWVHQYSSKVNVAGLVVDGNYSRQSVADLFAKGNVTPVLPEPDPAEEVDKAVILAEIAVIEASLTKIKAELQ